MSSSRSRAGSVDLNRAWLARTLQRFRSLGWLAKVAKMLSGRPMRASLASSSGRISGSHWSGGSGAMRGVVAIALRRSGRGDGVGVAARAQQRAGAGVEHLAPLDGGDPVDEHVGDALGLAVDAARAARQVEARVPRGPARWSPGRARRRRRGRRRPAGRDPAARRAWPGCPSGSGWPPPSAAGPARAPRGPAAWSRTRTCRSCRGGRRRRTRRRRPARPATPPPGGPSWPRPGPCPGWR